MRIVVDIEKVANGFTVNFNGGQSENNTYIAKDSKEVAAFVEKATKKVLEIKPVEKRVVEQEIAGFLG